MIKLLNIISIIILPFLISGVIKKTKAFWAGRRGVSILQPFWDVLKLMKKEVVYSETVSFIFKLTPILLLSSVIFASLFIPILNGEAIINIPFGFVVFSYVLGFGKFFSLIGAMDTGSCFEGMGASREACFSTIVEPAFFIGMGSIVALTQVSGFENLKMILENAGIYGFVIIALSVVMIFIMLLTECCRVPVDDPTTHLELTMIHEVMILDNSGADLGFITWASYIKMFLYQALIAALIIPAGLELWQSILAFLGIIFITSVIIGTLESSMARFRMSHVFEFIFIMTITSLLILTLVSYRMYGN